MPRRSLSLKGSTWGHCIKHDVYFVYVFFVLIKDVIFNVDFSVKNSYLRNRNRIDNLSPFIRNILIIITHAFYKYVI